MIRTKTVFILGAGASKPYKYPTGKELRLDIKKNFQGKYFRELEKNNNFPNFIFDQPKDVFMDEMQNFMERFKKSSGQSIDLFLSRNPQFEQIGKIAILMSILNSELKSELDIEGNGSDQDWYTYLFTKLTDDITRPDQIDMFNQNNLSIITFNYDRSLDYFLESRLLNSFTIHRPKAIEMLNSIPIYHVYGKVAPFQWEDGGGFEYKSGGWQHFDNIKILKDNIKVIYDRESQPMEDVKAEIVNAVRIFFLGFGFANENLEILEIPKAISYDTFIAGTGYGLTENEILKIKSKLRKRGSETPPDHVMKQTRIENKTCLNLLRDYL